MKIPEDKIFITNIRKGSITFDVVFKIYDFINKTDRKVNFDEKIGNLIDS